MPLKAAAILAAAPDDVPATGRLPVRGEEFAVRGSASAS